MRAVTLAFAVLILLGPSVGAIETRGLREKPTAITPEKKPDELKTKDAKPTSIPDQRTRIAELIHQLGDPSWQVREDATKRLIEIGMPARSALMVASRSPDAEIAARARRVLEKIPWAVSPDDLPEVAKLLANYQALDREDRKAVVAEIFSMGRFKAMQPLLRVVEFDDQEEVAVIAATLLRDFSFGSSGEVIRRHSFQSERPSSLALQGWAWRLHRPKQAVTLLEKSLTLQGTAVAANALSEMEKENILHIWGWILELGAADRFLVTLPPFENLFKNDSRMLFLRAKGAEIQGNAPRVRALVEEARAAPALPGIDPAEAHIRSAAFLKAHKWHDWEMKEWSSILALPTASPRSKIAAHVGLGWLAAQAARFDEAADHYLAAGEMAEDANIDLGAADPKDLQAEGQWNRARAIMARNELARLEETLRDMLRLSPGHPDGAGELARFLVAKGRKEDAEKLIEEARAELQKKFENPDGDMDEPTLHNNLAWLYVVANLHASDALEEATKAVVAAPYEVAFLDTLAEAYFRSGQKAKALERENYALSLEPDNNYLRRQIRRFETGEKNEPALIDR